MSGTVSGGRQHETDQIESTQLSLVLNNRDGSFAPWNGNLVPMCPIKVEATWQSVTYPIFHGFLDSATPDDPTVVDSEVTLKASDLLKYLNETYLSSDLYEQTISAIGPQCWYQFGDAPGTRTPKDSSGNGNTGLILGNVNPAPITGGTVLSVASGNGATWGVQGPIMYDPTTALDLSDGNTTSPTGEAYVQVPVGGITGSGAWTIEQWVCLAPGAGANDQTPWSATAIYDAGAPVSYQGAAYQFTVTTNWMGTWSAASVSYSVNDIVTSGSGNSSVYICIAANTRGQPVSDATFWLSNPSPTNSLYWTLLPQYARAFLADDDTTLAVLDLYTTQIDGGSGVVWVSGLNAGPLFSLFARATIADGNWHHVVVTCTARTAGAVKIYVDGTLEGAGTAGAGVATEPCLSGQASFIGVQAHGSAGTGNWYSPIFAGQIAQWAFYTSALTPTQINNNYTVGALLQQQELSGYRLEEVLTIVGVPGSLWQIDAGLTQVQNETSPTTTTTALSYAQALQQTEDGLLFVDPSGNLNFLNRATVFDTSRCTTVHGILSDEGPNFVLCYDPSPQIVQDDLDLWNTIQVQRRNGILQTASDQTSINDYGSRVLPGLTGLLQAFDSDALYLAQWLLLRFKQPHPRTLSVTVSSTFNDGAALPVLLSNELWYLMTMYRGYAPGGPPVFDDNEVIEWFSHTFTPGLWKTTYVLSPFEVLNQNNWFVLDASALDGSNILAY
jgi:hypothetical protein